MCVCVCVHAMENYSVIKKNEIMPFAFGATWMYLEIQTKLSKPDRERQIWYDITHMWELPRWH